MKRRQRRWAATVLLAAILGAAGAGFALRPRAEIVVAIDAAFAAMRPDLVAGLKSPNLFGNRLDLLLLPVDGAPGELLRELDARKLRPMAIAASPLVARALVEGAARNGAKPPAPVIALEWAPPPDSAARPTASLLSDPVPAARKLGSLLGSIVADMRRGTPRLGPASPSAQGALVWEPGPNRPDSMRDAFEEGWIKAAGSEPLVLNLSPGDLEADSLLRNLFGSDIRTLFVDAGDLEPDALDISDGKAEIVAFAADAPGDAARAWPSSSLVLEPDDAAFAALLRSRRAFSIDGVIALPSILKTLPGAGALRGIDLEARIKLLSR